MMIYTTVKEGNTSKSVFSGILEIYDYTGSFKLPKIPGRSHNTTSSQSQRHFLVDRFDTAAAMAC